MLYAFLRAIVIGAGVASVFSLILAVAIYMVDAGIKIAPVFFGVFLTVAPVCTLGAAIAAYVSHPSAKGPPALVRRWTVRLILRWAPRIMVRAAIGAWIGLSIMWPIFLLALIVGSNLGMVTQSQMAVLDGTSPLQILWFFTTVGCCVGALAAAVFGTVFAPAKAKGGPLVRVAVWNAIAGIIVGGWLISAVGLIFVLSQRWAWLGSQLPHETFIWDHLAWYGSIGAGFLTAAFLRWRRRPGIGPTHS